MRLTFWHSQGQHGATEPRVAKTKRELAINHNPKTHDPIVKVTIVYRDAFDLLEQSIRGVF